MSKAIHEGSGKTVDLAIKAAHAKIPGKPDTADEFVISKVVNFGLKTGGFAGVVEFYAVVEQVS